MLLARMSWMQVERHLEGDQRIVVPIGATEQHGPNGLIGTDHLTAGHIAEAAAEKAGVVVAPTIPYGMSHHHLAFPGTVSLAPATLQAIVRDVVASLARHGFRQILFVNGHGGNHASIEAAFSELGEQLPELWLERLSWFEQPEVVGLEKELFGERNGHHATPSEISVTQVFYGDDIEPIEGLEVEKPEYPWPVSSSRFRELFPDGRMESDPGLASAELGRKVFDTAVRALVGHLERMKT